MGFFPRAVGDTTPGGFSIVDDVETPFPLGTVDKPRIQNLSTRVTISGTGTLTIDNAVGGHFVYQPVTSDFAVEGEYKVTFRCVGQDGSVRYTDAIVGTVTSAL